MTTEETATIIKKRRTEMSVTASDDFIIYIKAPGARFAFENVGDFRTFLKMLTRFDERLP